MPATRPARTPPRQKGTLILATRFRIEEMQPADVTEVSRVERRCFDNPWPASAYRRELRNPRQNYYVVLRANPDDAAEPKEPEHAGHAHSWIAEGLRSRLSMIHLPKRGFMIEGPHIAGFAGMWCVYDEAHITTIGVDPHYRGRGFGEALLLSLFDEAIRRGCTWITLEVRVSNIVAQRMYQKFGMSVQGTRPHYYSDNGEDAYVMWSRSLRDPDYLALLEEIRSELRERLLPEIEVPSAPESPWHAGEPDELGLP